LIGVVELEAFPITPKSVEVVSERVRSPEMTSCVEDCNPIVEEVRLRFPSTI